MASFAMPGLRDGGLITVQRRSSTTSFRMLIIELPSTYFFSHKAKEVERTKADFDLAEEQAANFPIYDENLVLRTSDIVDLLWLIKGAMGCTQSTGNKYRDIVIFCNWISDGSLSPTSSKGEEFSKR